MNPNSTLSGEKRAFFLLLALVTLAGVLLRFVGNVPHGLNQDEASIGYDAWTLAHYGIDRNGYPWPVYPITWGSGGGSPLMVYLTVLATRVFGRGLFSLRFFPKLLGSLTPPLLALLAFAREKRGEVFGFLLAFLTVINPWHLMLSRWALDANTLPFFLALAILVFLWAADSADHRLPRYLLSAALFALCPYAYGSATIVIPVLLLLLGTLTVRLGRMTIKELLLSAFGFTLVLSPLILFFAVGVLGLPAIVTPYFSVPTFTASRSIFPSGLGLLRQMIDNMRYLFLLFTVGVERDELICNVLPGYAQMYRFTFPLTWAGICCSARGARRKNLSDACMLLLTVVTILFSLLIELDVNRVTLLLVPMLYFQALALTKLYSRKKGIAVAVSSALLCSAVLFARDYFGDRYAQLSREDFMPGYCEAVRAAVVLSGGEKPILSTYAHLAAPFMLALYETETPPDVFLNTVVWRDETAEFRVADAFADYTFGLPDELSDIDLDRNIVILHISELESFPGIDRCQTDIYDDFAVVSRRPAGD